MSTQLAIDGGKPVRSTFLVFGKPCLGEEEEREVLDTLRSGWIGTGPKALRFEQMFAEYVGCKHALAVNSCTAALHLSLIAAGIKPGDEVITSPLTFAATANVAVHAGARPVFADIDPSTLNIAPGNIERAITPRTRAVTVVHFGGLPCQMAEITGDRPPAQTGSDRRRCARSWIALQRPPDRQPGQPGMLQLLRQQEPDDRRRRHDHYGG